MPPVAVERFCEPGRVRNDASPTLASYRIDLRLFFTEIEKPLRQISWREVDGCVARQHPQGLAPTTINRRVHALKRCFDVLVLEQEQLSVTPVKPRHDLKQGRALPKELSAEHLTPLFARIEHPMDRAVYLSADAMASLRTCWRIRPPAVLGDDVCWNRK
jgi:site-specific recombinase XerC